MSRWRMLRLIAAKDLRIEWRSRVALYQVVPFAAVTLVMFAFALSAKSVRFEITAGGATRSVELLHLVAPGLVWLAVLFSVLMLVQRSFGIERADGALDALRMAGVDPIAMYWGKAAAMAVQLLVLELVIVPLAIVLYQVSIPAAGLALLAITLLLATAALASVGTLYGGLIAGFSGRESLLPLLVFPAVAPVLIGATRAVESAFGTDGVALAEGWPWLGLLSVFTIAIGVGGALAFGPLIEEAA